jgi:hypothetical protein
MARDKRPPFTRDEIRDVLGRIFEELDEWDSVIGNPPPNSDLADIKQAIVHATSILSRLSFNLYIRGMEAAEPGEV